MILPYPYHYEKAAKTGKRANVNDFPEKAMFSEGKRKGKRKGKCKARGANVERVKSEKRDLGFPISCSPPLNDMGRQP
jgi:hypothetical protein